MQKKLKIKYEIVWRESGVVANIFWLHIVLCKIPTKNDEYEIKDISFLD